MREETKVPARSGGGVADPECTELLLHCKAEDTHSCSSGVSCRSSWLEDVGSAWPGPSAACSGGSSSKSPSSAGLKAVGRAGLGWQSREGTAMASGGVADPSSNFKASRKRAVEK